MKRTITLVVDDNQATASTAWETLPSGTVKVLDAAELEHLQTLVKGMVITRRNRAAALAMRPGRLYCTTNNGFVSYVLVVAVNPAIANVVVHDADAAGNILPASVVRSLPSPMHYRQVAPVGEVEA